MGELEELDMSADKQLNHVFEDLVEESEKTKKLRSKLLQKLVFIDEQVTKTALDRKVHEIHHWISKHASQRILLKNKAISLFDENQNAAKLSSRVRGLMKKLDQEFQTFQVKIKNSDSSLKISSNELDT